LAEPAAAAMNVTAARPAAAPAQGAGPTADPARAAAASRRMMTALGEILFVFMKSAQFQGIPLGKLEQLVLPAALTDQFLVASVRTEPQGYMRPVAAALWASVSPEVDARLSAEVNDPFRLNDKEWRSGDIIWLVALAGEPRAAAAMMRKLQESRLKGRTIKSRVAGPDGQPIVRELDWTKQDATPQPATT
jgi:hemolysin-activating ACP:hemolysin acyltransferase